eukprot:COSAG06_NODE_5237_length_3619_cov_2.313920_1_plen_53_part_00
MGAQIDSVKADHEQLFRLTLKESIVATTTTPTPSTGQRIEVQHDGSRARRAG